MAGTPVPPKRGGRDEEEHTNHIEVLLQSYLMGSNYGKLLFSNKKFSFVCMLKILLFLKKWPALSHLEGKFILHSYFHRRHSTHTSILTSIYFHLNIMKFCALRSGTYKNEHKPTEYLSAWKSADTVACIYFSEKALQFAL